MKNFKTVFQILTTVIKNEGDYISENYVLNKFNSSFYVCMCVFVCEMDKTNVQINDKKHLFYRTNIFNIISFFVDTLIPILLH